MHQLYKYSFTIKKTECKDTQNNPCPDAIVAELKRYIGSNLITFKPEEVISKIMGSSIQYDNFNLAKKLPGTLSGTLQVSEEVALLETSTTSAYLVVLENLAVSDSTDEAILNIPLVKVESSPQITIGEKLTDLRILGGLKLLTYLQSNYVAFKDFTIATDSAHILTPQKSKVLFDTEKDFSRQLQSLQIIVQSELETPPSEIDLRYDKPILRD